MTTNQTIDGLLRKALADFIEYSVPGPYDQREKWEADKAKLRALLDAPACKTCNGLGHVPDGEVTGSGGVEFENGPVECVKDCPACKPAAQPQGEPVAYSYKVRVHATGIGMVWRDKIESEAPDTELAEVKDLKPLYAERPAPAAVMMSFDFEHPSSKEIRTVALSKRDVLDGMEDYFYEKLAEQICQCESVGETNVVDCNCDEYVHDFEIVQASLDELKRLNQHLVSQCPGDGVGPCKNCRCDRAGQSPQVEKYDDVLLPFLEMMRKELHANAGKGDRPGWLAMSRDQGMLEIYYHASKLQKAVRDGNGAGTQEYAADVANMCMMLLDICGGLIEGDAQ